VSTTEGILCALGVLAGLFVGAGLMRWLVSGRLRSNTDHLRQQEAESRALAETIVMQARLDADRVTRETELHSREEQFRLRDQFTQESEEVRTRLREQERRLEKREDAVEQTTQQLLLRERNLESSKKRLADRREAIDKRSTELEQLVARENVQLQEVAGLSRDVAEQRLLHRVETELSSELAQRYQKHEERLKVECEARSRSILATAVQRYAASHTADTTVSTVDIPSDDMKGRIIGREGRNIRTFEKATGVDVIVDDTPGVVIVSAFDNVRREIARISLSKLIQDGRIHPSRIEEVVLETQKEMEKHILDIGAKAVLEADIDPVHEKLVELLGRLRFRTSYSQNVLQHSMEVTFLTGMMASELGLDARLARRCALLHDVGKAADHEMEGGHPKIGADLAKRFGETSPEVLHAIAGHHDDITSDHIYTVLVAAADAISASRPGARRETLEKYVRRMEELEAIATGFPEVEHAYAIQAGRELRVIVNASRATDEQVVKMCRDIARTIEQTLVYPGEIKVTAMRELRIVEIAK